MSVSIFWCEDYGTAVATDPAIGGANRGASRVTGVTNISHKNAGDTATEYHAAPITAGQNGFDKYNFLWASGSYNSISDGLFQHVTGVPGAGLTYKLFITGSGGFATPATTTNALLEHNFNNTGLISTGYAVKFGIGGPEASGKASSSTSTGAYTEYLITQLQTTASAQAGDGQVLTYQFRWSEN